MKNMIKEEKLVAIIGMVEIILISMMVFMGIYDVLSYTSTQESAIHEMVESIEEEVDELEDLVVDSLVEEYMNQITEEC